MDEPSTRILFLEDDPGDARLAQENLRESMREEFICTWTSSVGETIQQLGDTQFDVVLL